MAFVKISLFACLLAAVNAQYTAAPVAYASPAYPSYVAHAPVPVAHVAHVPVASYAPVAHTVVAAAHPAAYSRILAQSQDSNPDGSYSFSYQTEDGSARSESGSPGAASVQGSYSYSGPEGANNVEYTADENGFQPSGPGVHPAIQQAVAEQVAKAKAEGPYQEYQPTAVVHHVAPVYHAPVYHAPAVAYHAPVYHAPAVAYHAPVPAYAPVAAAYHVPHVAVSPVASYVSSTPAYFKAKK